MGVFIRHGPCQACGSSDANALYDDGSWTCWSCNRFTPSPSGVKPKPEVEDTMDNLANNESRLLEILQYPIVPLYDRGIRQDTCEYYGVRSEISMTSGNPVKTFFPYGEGTKLTAFKAKTPDKRIYIEGNFKGVKLFGQNKCRNGGKLIMVTEGEEDCLISYQMLKDVHPQGKGYNVVSIQSGAKGEGSVAKELLNQLEFLESFEKVIICFDMDDPGQKYAQALGNILTPGKARIMVLSEKDPCDMYRAGKAEEFVLAFNNAVPVKSEGVVSGDDITLEELMTPIPPGYPIPFQKLNGMVHGLRTSELIIITGGSGLGKTTFAREIVLPMLGDPNESVANVYLEEGHIKTANGYIAMDNNVPLGLLRENPGIISRDAYMASRDKLISNGRTMFYKHRGSMASDKLIEKLKYFRFACNCKRIVLDHISLVVSGQTSSREGERKDIDILMTKLFSFVEDTDTTVLAIVHLSRNSGKKSFNEGAPVSLSDLRGSAALEQLSHGVWAIEGDQQSGDPNRRNIRVLKAREFGELGLADSCLYNPTTGRLIVAPRVEVGDEF